MKQVQAKACMSDLMSLPLRLPKSPVKIQIHPPPKWYIYWSGSYVGWLPRTLVKSRLVHTCKILLNSQIP